MTGIRGGITGLALVLALGGVAVANLQSLAPTPAQIEAKAIEERGPWYAANIAGAERLRVRTYTADEVIFSDGQVRESSDGHARGIIRVERSQPSQINGFTWRSARFDVDADCVGRIQVIGQAQPVAPPDPRGLIMTIYEGQNLTGAYQQLTLGQGALGTGSIGRAIASMCDMALADAFDARGVSDPVILDRSQASVRRWAENLPAQEDWREPMYEPTQAIFLAKEIPIRGGVARMRVRQEYIDPNLASSSSRAREAARSGGANRDIAPLRRPIWVRSSVAEWNVNCRAQTIGVGPRTSFVEHGLKNRADDPSNGSDRMSPIGPNHFYKRYIDIVCAGA